MKKATTLAVRLDSATVAGVIDNAMNMVERRCSTDITISDSLKDLINEGLKARGVQSK